MPKYGRLSRSLTKPKQNFKNVNLKRGKVAPAWNSNLCLKRRNPSIYVDPFRTKITPYSLIIPPNLKFRLQTFHLSARNLIQEETVLLRRPGAGITCLKVPILQCAAIYSKLRESMNKNENWGGDISLSEGNVSIVQEENPPRNRGAEESVIAEPATTDEIVDGGNTGRNEEEEIDDDGSTEHESDVGSSENGSEESDDEIEDSSQDEE